MSALTTSLELSNTFASELGWISLLTASRLVLPIWTLIDASFRFASDLASAADVPGSATTAWSAV